MAISTVDFTIPAAAVLSDEKDLTAVRNAPCIGLAMLAPTQAKAIAKLYAGENSGALLPIKDAANAHWIVPLVSATDYFSLLNGGTTLPQTLQIGKFKYAQIELNAAPSGTPLVIRMYFLT